MVDLEDHFKEDTDEAALRHWLLVLQVQREDEKREENQNPVIISKELLADSNEDTTISPLFCDPRSTKTLDTAN